MNKIYLLREDGKEVYHLRHGPIISGDKVKARLRNDSDQWETFEGVIKTAKELGIGDEKHYPDGLWLHIPGFHDFSIPYLHGCAVEIARV